MKLPVNIYSIKVIRKAFSLLEARLRRVFIWLVCLAIITSALEAIGVSLAFGLIQLVMDPDLIGNFPRIKVWLNISDGSLNGRLLAFAAISMGIFFLSKISSQITLWCNSSIGIGIYTDQWRRDRIGQSTHYFSGRRILNVWIGCKS